MTDRPAAVAERFRALADAAGGTDRPDWLATAVADPGVRDHLDALAAAVADGPEPGPAESYQALLGDEARAASGHFATDPGIAAALCRWAIPSRPDGDVPRVLDPAAGSGVFTAAAAARLAAVAPDVPVEARLAAVVGLDVDPVALALSARRLLDRTAAPDDAQVRLYERDFFDASPSDDRGVTVTDDGLDVGRFDAVVGNPPFVRQEAADTDRLRAHLRAFGPDGEAPYMDGDRALSRRSDLYVYFLTHATRFLRDGGRLGVVVPAKWLSTRYGESFQRFLFDHYAVEAVVGFGHRAFDDALVDTVLLLATRRTAAVDRRPTPIRFCRLDEQVSVERLLGLLESTPPAVDSGGSPTGDSVGPRGPDSPGPSPAVEAGDGYRVVALRQGSLADGDTAKLSPFLRAPTPFVRLLSRPESVPLGDLATIRRGVMTGANEFFFLGAHGRPADPIDDRFLTPAIKSIRDVDRPVVRTEDTDRSLLDVHEYVTDALGGRSVDDPAAVVRDALERDGYDGLLDHLAWGRREGYPERRSCATRAVWFDLGELAPPPVFVPKFFDERVLAVGNPDGLLASNAVDCLWPDETVDGRVLLGVLNATVTKALLECWGRREGGGALQVMTYELETLPVPDPRTFSPATREAIATATTDLLAEDPHARRELDRLVLDEIDGDLDVAECRRLREEMVQRRVEGGADALPPIVGD